MHRYVLTYRGQSANILVLVKANTFQDAETESEDILVSKGFDLDSGMDLIDIERLHKRFFYFISCVLRAGLFLK